MRGQRRPRSDVSRTGYVLGDVKETDDSIKAKLTLAGKPGNAYGHDIAELTLHVEYQDSGREHRSNNRSVRVSLTELQDSTSISLTGSKNNIRYRLT